MIERSMTVPIAHMYLSMNCANISDVKATFRQRNFQSRVFITESLLLREQQALPYWAVG
jgi:hypothetical protein